MARKPKDEFRNEELRGLFVLGLLAVFAAIRIQYPSFMVQVGSASFDIIPLLNILIILWSLYAFFMVLGFSEDIIGKTAAEAFRENSRLFLLFNFFILALFVIVFGIVGIPHFAYILVFISIFLGYFVYVRVSENRAKAKGHLTKRKPKRNFEALLPNVSMFVLLFSTLVMVLGQNETVTVIGFIVGVIAILLMLYSREKIRRKKAKQQLTDY